MGAAVTRKASFPLRLAETQPYTGGPVSRQICDGCGCARPKFNSLTRASRAVEVRRVAICCRSRSFLRAQFPDAGFPLPYLLGQLVDLLFLPDVPHAAEDNEQTDQGGLERRGKTKGRRLVFSIPCHAIFFPSRATARSGRADCPTVPPRPASMLLRHYPLQPGLSADNANSGTSTGPSNSYSRACSRPNSFTSRSSSE